MTSVNETHHLVEDLFGATKYHFMVRAYVQNVYKSVEGSFISTALGNFPSSFFPLIVKIYEDSIPHLPNWLKS